MTTRSDVALHVGMALGNARQRGAPQLVLDVLAREYDSTHRTELELPRLADGLRGVLVELGQRLDSETYVELSELLRMAESVRFDATRPPPAGWPF